MKKYYLLFTILLTSIINISFSQIHAVTESGKEVLLNNDGTWLYAENNAKDSISLMDSTTTNPVKFSKPGNSTFLVKSKRVNIGIYIDTKKWVFSGAKENESNPEYRFSLRSTDGFGMLITETTEIGLENMQEIALINAQKAAPDAKIIKSEYRTVNNLKVLCLQFKGTINGLKFMYLAYYYSNEKGTIQIVTASAEKSFATLYNDFENYLNGLVLIK